jgi:7-carboxy-7-deazaguanine synthase (Cx14CxxC type)
VYSVKESFYTLQGEGAQSGRAAVFCRFAGCNLWSGREEDRAKAQCRFCDTQFVGTDGQGGGKFSDADALASHIDACWPDGLTNKYVVMTGGEPLLQLDTPLIAALHQRGFEVAVETNGTVRAPEGIDWICVSPKAGNPVLQTWGHELKVVVPQTGLDFLAMQAWDFRHRFVQPMDNAQRADNLQWAIAFCMQNPQWRLGLQTHKIMGLP